MNADAKKPKERSERETQAIRDAALRRALGMPPKEHAAKPKPPAKKRKKASGS